MSKAKINFEKFLEITSQLEIRMGVVVEAEMLPKNKKMMKLLVMMDEEPITVVTNIGDKITPDEIRDKRYFFVTNLEPSVISGITSEAMILIPNNFGEPAYNNFQLIGSTIF